MIIANGFYMHLIPLQIQATDFWKKNTPEDAIFLGIGVGTVIFILIIVNIIKKRFNIPALNGGASGPASTPRRFSSFTLRRVAGSFGLNREQTKMLEFVLKSDGVTDPERSLNSATLLDRHFKRAYNLIERTALTDDELHEKLSVLFSIRNIIESNSGGVNASSTRQIPANAVAVLAVNGQNYQVRVVSARGDALVIENPVSNTGAPIRLPRGSKVSLAFFTKSSKGFSFDSRVLGSKEDAEGLMLYLAHSGQIKRLSNRRFRRRQTVISASFYLVHIETGRRNEKKMVVDKRRLTGSIMDISIGGCSVKTSAPVSSGQHIKIEFNSGGSSSAALGQVLRTNRTGISTIMHIKFLKVPRRSLNSINAVVYEYANE